jgi:hypothetical protein
MRRVWEFREFIDKAQYRGKAGRMKVIRAPRTLLASSAALFLLVPVAVITAGIFSSHVWWDLPMAELLLAGWIALVMVAPISWRLIMGRRGAWHALAAICALVCLGLLLQAAWMRGTIQGLWAVVVCGLCTVLLAWTRQEQRKSYFDPGMPWFQGLPVAIPRLTASMMSGAVPASGELQVCRLDSGGVFVFSRAGSIVPRTEVELELRHGEPHSERKTRITGTVVRQFEGRSSKCESGDWGVGIQFHPLEPDAEKDFRDFLEVLRGEGCIHV